LIELSLALPKYFCSLC